MSFIFDSINDRLLGPTTAIPQALGTLALWYKPTWAFVDGVIHYWFEAKRAAATDVLHMHKAVSDILLDGWFINPTSYRASGTTPHTQNAWNHLAVTWNDTTNDTIHYLNGVNVGSNLTTLVTATTDLAWAIGNREATLGNANFAGRIAHLAIWTAELTPADVTILNSGAAPTLVQLASLQHYWTLNGLEAEVGGFTLTNEGDNATLDTADNPAVYSGGGGGRSRQRTRGR